MKTGWIRRGLYAMSILCAALLLVFIADEAADNRAAAAWAAEGFPDLRAPHHNYFWPRILGTAGVGLFAYGAAIAYFSEEKR